MHLIAKQMKNKQIIFRQNQGWRFSDSNLKQEQTELYSLMNEISSLMNATILNVDQRRKNKEIVWFFQSYGMCCDLMGDYDKSVRLYARAKLLMAGVYKDDTDRYKALGHCYNTIVELHERAERNNLSTFKQFLQICFIVIAVTVFVVFLLYFQDHSKDHIKSKNLNATEKQNDNLGIIVVLLILFGNLVAYLSGNSGQQNENRPAVASS